MARRTGLRVLYNTVKKICQIFATWNAALHLVVPPQYHVYLDALSQACDDFMANVPVPSILGDEDAPPVP